MHDATCGVGASGVESSGVERLVKDLTDMAHKDQEQLLFESLVFLTDTLVTGFDVIDLADKLVHTCVDLLNVRSAGILLDDQRNALRVIAASSEDARALELMELLNEQGPCLEAFATGREVTVLDLAGERPEWTEFVEQATSQGIVAAHSFPMRLRDQTIGALNLFSDSHDALTAREQQVARVLSDIATIGILNHRALREQEILAEQLQRALTSRIIIEQAKGVISQHWGVPIESAFSILREAARTSQRPLTELAAAIADGQTPIPPWPKDRSDDDASAASEVKDTRKPSS